MNNYRSAYESYYRNLNKHDVLQHSKPSHGNSSRLYVKKEFNSNNIEKILVRQIGGAVLILLSFTILKNMHSHETDFLYSNLSSLIKNDISYDDTIERAKTIVIDGQKLGDMNINGVTLDDFKEKNIKNKVTQCFDYIKQTSNNVEEKQL